ncbi:uncharacterized protein LOC126908699 [Daktulosphaira vitifoliae]|uniref:uncharacterized protein LOC126908699 n=1 Tax=Daktulosphaira vitifoliae TaxID=58002 RepID=UPI0021AA4EB5|nr:uncharacterized protein LOC126908699 [Daktulosphaira vitifoliae]
MSKFTNDTHNKQNLFNHMLTFESMESLVRNTIGLLVNGTINLYQTSSNNRINYEKDEPLNDISEDASQILIDSFKESSYHKDTHLDSEKKTDNKETTNKGCCITMEAITRICLLSTMLKKRRYSHGLKYLLVSEYCFENGHNEIGLKYIAKFLMETKNFDEAVSLVRKLEKENIDKTIENLNNSPATDELVSTFFKHVSMLNKKANNKIVLE